MMNYMPKPRNDRRYTYQDYITWDGPERWELLDGFPYMMASPTPKHQQVLGELFFTFRGYLGDKPCTPFIAPLDVTFEEDEQTNTVVQPDLFVMCGEFHQTSRIVGTPVFVVEILSPSTTANDTIRKLNLYQRTKVQEYWIVESDEKIVNVYLHDGTLLRWTAAYRPGETLSPSMFMDLKMNVSDIF